jgi:hypothetical protein
MCDHVWIFEARTLSTQPASREGDVTLSMIRSDDALPINERTAERLIKIAFGDLRHHPQIMGDENDGGAHPLLDSLIRSRICA